MAPHPDEQRPAWWVPRVLAAATATVVVIGGVAWAAGDQRGPTSEVDGAGQVVQDDGRRTVPAGDPQQEPEREPDQPRDLAVTTYAVGRTAAGPRLFADRQLVEDATGDPVQVAVAQLVTGQVVDDDLATAWPVQDVRVATRGGGDRVVVDLAGLATGTEVGRTQAVTAMQALVWTVDTATRSRLPVQVLLDGAPAEELWGIDLRDPVAPDEGALSPVTVDSPADGAVVSSAFTVRGWARTDDGRLLWQLRDGGEVVRQGEATAEVAGRVAPYEFDVSSPAGDFTLVVSLADGGEDTRRLKVR